MQSDSPSLSHDTICIDCLLVEGLPSIVMQVGGAHSYKSRARDLVRPVATKDNKDKFKMTEILSDPKCEFNYRSM